MGRVIYCKSVYLFKVSQITFCRRYLPIKPILALISKSTGLRVRRDPTVVQRRQGWTGGVWGLSLGPTYICSATIIESSMMDITARSLKGLVHLEILLVGLFL